jgi:hypothetical protein
MPQEEFLPSCDCKDLVPLAKCFRDPCVSPVLRKAIQIVLLNFIISALNEDSIYTLPELLAMGKCCGCNIGDLDRDAIFTYLLWAVAQQISQEAPTSEKTLIQEACKLSCGKTDLDAIMTPLWCSFFKAASTIRLL